jgi:ATP-dependent protease ClpP protease subunit
MADIMELMDADIAETYAAKAGGSKEEWLNLMDKETWFSAAQALEAGLVDEVVNLDDDEDKPYKAEVEMLRLSVAD